MPKTIRFNVTYYFIIKLPNKTELTQTNTSKLSDIEFKGSIKHHNDYTKYLFSFLVDNTTLTSDNPLKFTKNLLQNNCW